MPRLENPNAEMMQAEKTTLATEAATPRLENPKNEMMLAERASLEQDFGFALVHCAAERASLEQDFGVALVHGAAVVKKTAKSASE